MPGPLKLRGTHSIARTASFSVQIAILALSVVVYRFHSRYYDSTPCDSDPPIEIRGVWFRDNQGYAFQKPCALFSSEYVEARRKFRDAVERYNATTRNHLTNDTDATAAKAVHAELWSSPVAAVVGEDGPVSLTLEVAVLPGNTQRLGTIVHSSGVHGVEGYAGSAIQLALLELLETSTRDDQLSPKHRPTIVMIHAVNPVGMKEYRRCNENNVDLNRNGIILTDEAKNDGKNGGYDDNHEDGIYVSFEDFVNRREPNIAGYDDFRHLFVPDIENDDGNDEDGGLSWYDSTIGFYIRAIPALAKHGLPALKRAMVAGQYHHPEGLNYGGQALQPSVRQLLDIFARDRPEFFTDSPHVVWIDVHTGLGPFGKDSVLRHAHITYPEEGNEDDSVVIPELDDFLSMAYSVTSTANGETSNAQAFKGYDLSKGMLMDFFGDFYRKIQTKGGTSRRRKTGIFLVQEFGTLPTLLVGRALILDNILYHFRKNRHQRWGTNKGAGRSEQFSYRSPFLGYAFYPQSTEWRNSIIQRGVAIVLQTMEYSMARSIMNGSDL